MNGGEFTPRAAVLWGTIAKEARERILANVFCVKCRGKAPHKPLLLLCLLDLAEAGELAGRTFTRTAGLVLRFKS